jgi:hypothetical protein
MCLVLFTGSHMKALNFWVCLQNIQSTGM